MTSKIQGRPYQTWGRNRRRTWTSSLASLGMMILAPMIITFARMTITDFDGSIQQPCHVWRRVGPTRILFHAPAPTWKEVFAYLVWVLFQALLYTVLPGRGEGQFTPAGHKLQYRTNGFLAWMITVSLAVYAVWAGLVDPCIIADHWAGLTVVASIYGFALTLIAYVKAHLAPTHPLDRKFSGSIFYDLYMGIELNPGFGESWDWKLFHNGRPGIIAWTLIDLSFASTYFRTHPSQSLPLSIVLLNLLHNIYIIDLLLHEKWYVRTIDIAHDHFGFYLAWGSAVWLPTMYTLQAQFLAVRPVELTALQATCVLVLGVGGYALFRSANGQKDLIRRAPAPSKCVMFGRPVEFLRARYATVDGKQHESLLLMSGWWSFARHANYTGDLMLSVAMCATCGFDRVLPWFYAVYMGMLLVQRCWRDERKCGEKYGVVWEEYCRRVRWRLVPGIY